jgi:hypothetical protein
VPPVLSFFGVPEFEEELSEKCLTHHDDGAMKKEKAVKLSSMQYVEGWQLARTHPEVML